MESEQVADVNPVSLKSVVHEMDILSDEMTAYINKKTGELFTFSEEEENIIEAGKESAMVSHRMPLD